MPTRLEAIDAEHPDTVALMRGPLVLFAVTENAPRITRQQLLAASPVNGESAWQAQTTSGPVKLLPFPSITDERYPTYMTVS
jgi:hypothetical protein